MLELFLPLHPKLVHFPIALFISALGVQILGMLFKKDNLYQAAWMMFILAVISTPIVILSGLWEEKRLGLAHPTLDEHKNFAFLTLWISLAVTPVLWFLKAKNVQVFRVVFLILLIVIGALVTLAAHYGGEMVFEAGVGVNQ